MGRLLMIEGLPGTGKTTIAAKVAEYLSGTTKAELYQEGDAHPADLAWCACIPETELKHIFLKFPEYEGPMKEVMYLDEGYAIVPYCKFPIKDGSFYDLMESYEVYDNRVDYDTFTGLHKSKWSRFGLSASESHSTHIFECSFLQNHINELLLFHNKTETEITVYLQGLLKTVTDLQPVIIYLNQPDIRETLQRVSEVRVDEQGKQVWRERVIAYIENSPYGKVHNLKGFDGMVTYFGNRKKLELDILKVLPIQFHIIHNNGNWEEVWSEIKNIIDWNMRV